MRKRKAYFKNGVDDSSDFGNKTEGGSCYNKIV